MFFAEKLCVKNLGLLKLCGMNEMRGTQQRMEGMVFANARMELQCFNHKTVLKLPSPKQQSCFLELCEHETTPSI
jgi:hypothetical protein